jgi:hypothetical protein
MDNPTMAKDCNLGIASKCCLVTSTDAAVKAVCVNATGTTEADQKTSVTNKFKNVATVNCNAVISTGATAITASTCPATKKDNPTQTSDCNAGAKDKCCFVTNNANPAVKYCVSGDATKTTKADLEAGIKSTYSNLLSVDCGADAPAVSPFPTAGNCSITGTVSKNTDCWPGKTDTNRCCFVTNTDGKTNYCVASGKASLADANAYITSTYGANVKAGFDCSSGFISASIALIFALFALF